LVSCYFTCYLLFFFGALLAFGHVFLFALVTLVTRVCFAKWYFYCFFLLVSTLPCALRSSTRRPRRERWKTSSRSSRITRDAAATTMQAVHICSWGVCCWFVILDEKAGKDPSLHFKFIHSLLITDNKLIWFHVFKWYHNIITCSRRSPEFSIGALGLRATQTQSFVWKGSSKIQKQ